jgi:hypothetical protein
MSFSVSYNHLLITKTYVMLFSFLRHRQRNQNVSPSLPHPAIKHHELHHDISEGEEFFDDAIHMEDVQVTRTELSIAAGSPENLL